jgi:hypothetical protein
MKKQILIVVAIILLTSCSKDNATETPADTLPPATTTGANTAGCYINGKLLIPKNGSQAIGGPALYGLKIGGGINFIAPIIGDDYFYVRIQNLKDSEGDDIYLHFSDMTQGVGNYTIGQSNGDYFIASPHNNHVVLKRNLYSNNIKTYISPTNAGIITVTRFDYPNGIYSGIFNMTLYNVDNPSETIQITDGRFDINVATLNR